MEVSRLSDKIFYFGMICGFCITVIPPMISLFVLHDIGLAVGSSVSGLIVLVILVLITTRNIEHNKSQSVESGM